MSELVCLLDGRDVGIVRRMRGGRLSFTYTDSWRRAHGSYPLSLSMPLIAAEHGHSVVEPFLWGLLPDNEFVIRRWASALQISPQNVLGLIASVGEDCAGAVQFLTPEKAGVLQARDASGVAWLTEAELASRLRRLRTDASAARTPGDLGQFSLAGAQPKTALVFDGQRWGVPFGRMPTTHIFKPSTPDYDGHAENEHVCLALARALGLPTASSEVRQFEDVTAIIVTRYDRVDTRNLVAEAAARAAAAAARSVASHVSGDTTGAAHQAAQAAQAAQDAQVMAEFAVSTPIYRVHQEDFCQALSFHPSKKYQNDGGPSPVQIVKLLRTNVHGSGGDAKRRDVQTFIDALAFNWIIGGTDAHGKNYSVLIGGEGLVRLAPLYDVASIFAYPTIDPDKAKLAMKIGADYRLRDINGANWRALAMDIGVDPTALIDGIRTMAQALPDALSAEVLKARAAGLDHPIISVLQSSLTERATRLSVTLAA